MCKVVNLYKEPYDIYIGRAGKGGASNVWCNPLPLNNTKDDSEREANLINYRNHLRSQINKGIITLEMLASLDGKKLGCFCKPKKCHGDVLVKACAWAKQVISERDNL